MKGNAVVGQSGGPTSVINASLAGVIRGCRQSALIKRLWGMHFGIEGFLKEDIIDLSDHPDSLVTGLEETPSSALGSSRYKLRDEDLPGVVDILKKHDIRFFFLIGGNDTMDTVHRIESHCMAAGWEMRGIGIPKTVDNDLYGTDHTPGFPSAARASILNVRQAGLLAHDMRGVDRFVIYQTIGRNAGWLAAATALARSGTGSAPHLIYCPENTFFLKNFLRDCNRCIADHGWVYVVVSEGLLWDDGTPVSDSRRVDSFANTEFGAAGGGSAAMNLHRILAESTGLRGEFQVPESLLMCAMDRAEPGDIFRAGEVGRRAVVMAENGLSGLMVAITRSAEGEFGFGSIALGEAASKTKLMPPEYLSESGNDVTREFLGYMGPLISRLPSYTALDFSR